MDRRPRITVVGSFAVGFTMRAPRFPQPGETLIGSQFSIEPGGKGSNQAVGAARLGAAVQLVGKIGRDAMGDVGISLWRGEGVGVDRLLSLPDLPTGVGFITVNADGENTIVVDLGANRDLTPADVDAAEDLIANCDAVLTVLEIPVAAAARALELGRRHGVMTVLNPAPAQPLDDAILELADIVTPNRGELRTLAGLAPDDPADDAALAQDLRRRGARTVVVTRGEQGALIVIDEAATSFVPSAAVDVVDTTGAGDAFSCALTVALAGGTSLADAVAFAGCAGALVCTRLGVIPALPDRASVEACLAERGDERG